MTEDLQRTFALLVLLSPAVCAAPATAQSAQVNFPMNGRVIVEAREEVGKFPQIVFTSERTHQQLLLSSIEDKDKWLIPLADEPSFARPVVRFRLIRARGLRSPMVMAWRFGISYGTAGRTTRIISITLTSTVCGTESSNARSKLFRGGVTIRAKAPTRCLNLGSKVMISVPVSRK